MSLTMMVNQMLSLFFIMIVGYAARRAKILQEEAPAMLTKLVLNISVPALIISSFLENRGMVSNMMMLEVFGISLLCHVAYLVMAKIFVWMFRITASQRGTYSFMLVCGNVGFMGYPVIQAVFGQEGMIYAVIYNIIFNVVVYSLGIALIGGDKAGKFNPKMLLNLPMISTVAAILLYFTPIQLPECVSETLDYLGNLTTPLAMLILGTAIARMPLRELFCGWVIYAFTAWRLLVLPAGIYLLLKLLGIHGDLLIGTLVILSGMPVATNATMLSIEYDGDVDLASRGIFFSTVLSVVTIPVIAMLL